MLVALAQVDNSIDENEESIIEESFAASKLETSETASIRAAASAEATTIRDTGNVLFVRRKKSVPQKLNWFQRLIQQFVLLLHKLFRKKEKLIEVTDDIEYRTAIEQCALIAREDFSFVKPIYSKVLDSCTAAINEIRLYKKSMSLETGYAAEIAKVIDAFVNRLNDDVLGHCSRAQISLEQKERTVSDFTISLLGRTKAGKSTLHAILTNQGKDRIGAGKQRTTRYNQVYQWNLLRLIDTPGIGSAEAAGRTDDEIAESVLGESDIICFVVVDDSILRDVLDFIKKIAELNKPIIILLNHKENIRPEVKYNRFLARPREWLETAGEANLAGHIDRIQKYADENGFGSLIKVYPVFLLPALMSSEPEYADNSDLLWDSSNIESFITQLKEWISVYGTIKRTQTILDEAIQVFAHSRESIESAERELMNQKTKLSIQREHEIKKLKLTEDIVCRQIREILEEKFDRLAKEDALIFAEEVYADRGDYSVKWTSFVARIGFEDEIRDAINSGLQLYVEKATDAVASLLEDFCYSARIFFNIEEISIPTQFDFKTAARLLGGVAGTVGSIILAVLGSTNPIGWIISGTGLLLELSSFLFTSKEKKRQKAIDKIYKSIRSKIEESSPEEIEKILTQIRIELSAYTEKVEMLFQNLEDGLEKTLTIAGKLSGKYDEQIATINQQYGFRLLQFVCNHNKLLSSVTPDEIVSVDRSEPGQIKIITTASIEQTAPYSLDGVIAERIFIERRSKNE